MIERTSIVRVPIKIRKAIQKEYCDCYDATIMTADGIPQLIIGDKLTESDMDRYLASVKLSTPMYFSHPNTSNYVKCLDKGLPVTIRTDIPLSADTIDRMSSVPHCAIHVCIDDNSQVIDPLWDMMHIAKGKKIHLVLETRHIPHLVHKLDLLEVVNMTKNLVNHMLLSFPSIPDEFFRRNMDYWELKVPGSTDVFKHMYAPHVPSRSWELKPKYQQEIVSGLQDFIKSKRVSLELLHIKGDEGRIRHTSLRQGLPLGIRPFMYESSDGIFAKVQEYEETPCTTCGKTIFL